MKKTLLFVGIIIGMVITFLGEFLKKNFIIFQNYIAENWSQDLTLITVISVSLISLILMYWRNRFITNRCKQGIKPGMYLYSDGTISPAVVSGKTISGIVVETNGFHGFAVGLREARLTYFAARLWCFLYCYDGVCCGRAFMGKRKHLEALERKKSIVNEAIAYLVKYDGRSFLTSVGGYIWAKDATAYDVGRFAYDLAADGYTKAFSNCGSHCTRCFIKF